MSFSKQDINTAIKNLDVFLKIPDLKGAIPVLKENRDPFSYTGGFNMVFKLEHQNKRWAFRVWHVPMGETKKRYQKISNYLREKSLPYFADFIYDEGGILVNGTLHDTIRMEWLEGKLLKEYIEDNLQQKFKLTKLADDFLEMCKDLRKNEISHGDLQEGNILIDHFANIKLVDYDSVCIPEIEYQKELVTGLNGYQHPSRFKSSEATLKADYFSELVIYLSILAIAENPNLWTKYQVKDTQYLLFSEIDFNNFENSEIFKDLKQLSGLIKSLTRILNEYIDKVNFLELKPIENYLSTPKINSLAVTTTKILKGNSSTFSWDIENVDGLIFNNGIGNVLGQRELQVSPNHTTVYKITVENFFNKIEEEITIEVFPLPKVIDFRSKQQKLEYGKETDISWNVENAEKVELHYDGVVEMVNHHGQKAISPKEDSIYKIFITALDGVTIEEKELSVHVFKRVEIKRFVSDFEFVVESYPIKLSWDIENASSVLLSSDMQPDIDVTNKCEIEIVPKKYASFYLKASNGLFSKKSEEIKINVQTLPVFNPGLVPRLPSGKELLPSFELNFKDLSESILSESQIHFQKAMEPTKKFNLLGSLKKIFG